ncbi:MAG TPA: PAS domain S-box protein [Verrucomicrobiae bacterium]|nr:PAS domain S-box protein [Verrucomicrobiae bacterium]
MKVVAPRLTLGQHALLLENAAEAILVAQRDRLAYVNPAGEQMLGYSAQELASRPFLEFIHPEDRPLVAKRYAERLQGLNPPAQYSFRFVSAAGRTVWVELKAIRITWGEKPATLNFLSDITERRRAETVREALLNLENRLSAVTTPAEAARSIFAVADQLWSWDAGTLDLYRPEDDVADAVLYFDVLDGQRREVTVDSACATPTPRIRRILEQGPELLLRTEPRQEGAEWSDTVMFGDTTRPSASMMWVPIRCQDRMVGVMSVQSYTTDAFTQEDLRLLQGLAEHCGGALERLHAAEVLQAERKRAEAEQDRLRAQLQQAQKMEALGTLAGGIAHDFNNILGAILGNAELARHDIGPNHPAAVSLQEIKSAGRRAKELVQRILAFSRPQQPIRQAISLQPVIEEILKLLRSTLPATVQLVHETLPDTPMVLADVSQVHQVIMNLATNGWHALEDRPGCIRITLAPYQAHEPDPGPGGPELRPGRYARLSVSDTGKGMDPATLQRVFEPFFTTKAVGKGTGLGLSMVHGIMKAHQGDVSVESRLGHGATFHLFFPAAPMVEKQTFLPASVPTASDLIRMGSGQRILVLDDDAPMTFLVERLLGKLGYQVRSHTSAAQALAAFHADPAAFDLVITDLSMPGISGLDVAREILERRPQIPVVLVSGHLRPEEIEQARKIGVREVVLKPSAVDELAPVVRRLLAQ